MSDFQPTHPDVQLLGVSDGITIQARFANRRENVTREAFMTHAGSGFWDVHGRESPSGHLIGLEFTALFHHAHRVVQDYVSAGVRP